MKHTKLTFNRIIRTLFIVIPSLFSLVGNIAVLLKIEARLAGKSLIILTVVLLGVFVLLITSWICVLSMALIYFISLHWSLLYSLFMVFLINIVLLAILGFIICRVKQNLSFPETRYQLSRIADLQDE